MSHLVGQDLGEVPIRLEVLVATIWREVEDNLLDTPGGGDGRTSPGQGPFLSLLYKGWGHCPPNRPVKACVLTKPLPAAPDCPTKRRALNREEWGWEEWS
jgi:hypothetical protein